MKIGDLVLVNNTGEIGIIVNTRQSSCYARFLQFPKKIYNKIFIVGGVKSSNIFWEYEIKLLKRI